MLTTDDLQAAGERAAARPVDAMPTIEELQREVGRRRQTQRLGIGAGAATLVMVAVGSVMLLRSGDEPMQVIAATPAESPAIAEPAAQTPQVQRSQGAFVAADSASEAGSEAEAGDGAEPQDEAAAASGVGVEVEVEGGAEGGVEVEVDGSPGSDGAPGLDGSDGGELDRWIDEEWFELPLPDDFFDEERLEELGRWFDDVARTSVEVWVGDRAQRRADRAARAADEVRNVDGLTVWIRNVGGDDDDDDDGAAQVRVSALHDGDLFIEATGARSQTDALIDIVVRRAAKMQAWPDDDRWPRRGDWLLIPPDSDGWDGFEQRFEELEGLDGPEELRKWSERFREDLEKKMDDLGDLDDWDDWSEDDDRRQRDPGDRADDDDDDDRDDD
ncbi:MAG: hypothetical protein AAF547_18750 [Actinomycetota bacterium]